MRRSLGGLSANQCKSGSTGCSGGRGRGDGETSRPSYQVLGSQNRSQYPTGPSVLESPVPLCSLSSPSDSQVWTQTTHVYRHIVVQTQTHTYAQGHSDTHFRSQASGQGRPREAGLREQEAEALGAADFLPICLFPKRTYCPPAHTTHTAGEPPPKPPILTPTEQSHRVSALICIFVPC